MAYTRTSSFTTTGGNIQTVSWLVGSDPSLTVKNSGSEAITVEDASLGQISFDPVINWLTRTLTATQDVQWPDNGGTLIITDHPINTEQVLQIETNRQQIEAFHDDDLAKEEALADALENTKNVQGDFLEADPASPAFIKNKPNLVVNDSDDDFADFVNIIPHVNQAFMNRGDWASVDATLDVGVTSNGEQLRFRVKKTTGYVYPPLVEYTYRVHHGGHEYQVHNAAIAYDQMKFGDDFGYGANGNTMEFDGSELIDGVLTLRSQDPADVRAKVYKFSGKRRQSFTERKKYFNGKEIGLDFTISGQALNII